MTKKTREFEARLCEGDSEVEVVVRVSGCACRTKALADAIGALVREHKDESGRPAREAAAKRPCGGCRDKGKGG